MKPAMFAAFQELRDKNLMAIKNSKENGGKVIGFYCTYGPRELALAADAIAVGLCGTREAPIAAAERDLPRNLCPLIKSSYGFAVSDTCPFFGFSDMVVGETTCDGKKKMFELMGRLKPVHVMSLPQNPDLPSSLALMREEIIRLKSGIEQELQAEITDEKLKKAIHITNEEARALKDLFDLNKEKPALITGMEMLMTSFATGFNADREEGVGMLNRLTAEIRQMAGKGYHVGSEKSPRILLTGTPVGMGSEKVVALVEESGGLIIAMENCGGYKTVDITVDETDSRDPITLLAEKYLRIPCSVMSPNTGRLDLLERMIKDFKIDGVIDLTWQACHTYNVESFQVADLVKNKLGLPFIQLETDYSDSDREILRVRIEAFLEMI